MLYYVEDNKTRGLTEAIIWQDVFKKEMKSCNKIGN